MTRSAKPSSCLAGAGASQLEGSGTSSKPIAPDMSESAEPSGHLAGAEARHLEGSGSSSRPIAPNMTRLANQSSRLACAEASRPIIDLSGLASVTDNAVTGCHTVSHHSLVSLVSLALE